MNGYDNGWMSMRVDDTGWMDMTMDEQIWNGWNGSVNKWIAIGWTYGQRNGWMDVLIDAFHRI